MSLDRAKTARSAFWSAMESGSLALVSFIMLVTFSRILEPRDFGVFSVVLALVEILNLFVGMLFHDALVQKKDARDIDFDTAFTISLGVSFVLVAATFLLAPWFSRLVDYPEAAPVLRWLCLVFPISALSSSIIARLRRRFEFKALAIRSLTGRVAGAAAGIAAALNGAGVWSLVIQQVVMLGVGAAILWLTCRDRPRVRFALGSLRDMGHFGLSSISVLILQFGIVRAFTIAVGILVGAEQAGYVNIAFRTVDVFWAIAFTAIAQVALPTLSRLQSDSRALTAAYRQAVALASVVLFPLFVGLGLLAPEAVEILYGRDWLPSAPIVTILALSILARGVMLFHAAVLSAVGRPQDSLIGLTAECVFLLVAILLLQPALAMTVVAIWMARELACVPIRASVVRRACSISYRNQLGGALVPLMSTGVMAAGLLLARQGLSGLDAGLSAPVRALLLVPLGGTLYIGALFALDRKLLSALMRFGLSGLRGASAK